MLKLSSRRPASARFDLDVLESRRLLAAAPKAIAASPKAGGAAAPRVVTVKPVVAIATAVGKVALSYDGTRGGDGTGRLIPAAASVTFDARADGLPLLDSNPNAAFTIFLDFDGHDDGAGSPQAAMSLDADASTFNAEEQAAIVNGWRQVATFLAPFDVRVTTVQPDASREFSWTLIGNGVTDATSNGTVHVAGAPVLAPSAFNPTSDLTGRVTRILQGIGRNVGLTSQRDYDATGKVVNELARATDALHAPIMGLDTDGVVPAWIVGHSANSGATALQDDVAGLLAAIVAAPGGTADGYRADDVPAATALTLGTPFVGAIETLADVDAFTFTVDAAGRYDVSAARDGLSGVDLKLQVLDASGTLLASADNQANDQAVRLDLAAGTYTVLVKSHGNYADLGQYRVLVAPATARASWTFDEGIGETAADSGRAGATATINGATWTIDGRDGTAALSFDGVDDLATAGAAASISGLTDFTAAAWLRTTDADGGVILRQPGAYSLSINADGTLRFSVAGGAQFDIATTLAVNDGAWHRVVVQRIGREGRIYVDGARAAFGSGATQMLAATAGVTIGGDVTTGSFLAGTIDDVRIDDLAVNVLSTPYTGLGPATVTATRGGIDATTNRPQINLAWTTVADAATYAILSSVDGATYTTLATVDASMQGYVATVPDGARRYFFKVIAVAADGVTGSVSAPANALSLPQAIANGRVSVVGSKTLVLDWPGGDSTGETAYRIERSTDGVTFATLTSAHPANVPSYTATGLAASTTYWFRVTPLDGTSAGAPIVLTGTTAAPLATVTGVHVAARDATSLSIAWTDAADEAGYRLERSPDGVTWTTRATLPADATSFVDDAMSSLTEYHYRVVATAPESESLPSAQAFGATLASGDLPEDWAAADVGAVGAPGATGFAGPMENVSAGEWTSLASGADIGGTADAFRFVYRTLDGDGQIVARVTGLENTNGRARAGVMIREGFGTGARNALMAITAAGTAEFSSRGAAGGATTTSSSAGPAVPQWVKLVRRGSTLTGFSSVDGVYWTRRGTVTLTGLAGSLSIGLANVSADNTVFSTASFANVSLPADAVDPTVEGVRVDVGTAQRSVVRSLTVTFAEPVTLLSGAIDLRRAGGAATISAVATPAADGRTFVVTFAGTGVTFGSLDDGRYSFKLLAERVVDAAGNTMASDSTTAFTRLFGDVDGDLDVDNLDSLRFRFALGTTSGNPAYRSDVDYDNDGDVDNLDSLFFRTRLGTTVPSVQLAGTPIGTPGSFQNAGNTVAKAFDGNLSSYFDAPAANNAWAGLDLGGARVIDQIKYAPRSGYASRMVGGAFEGANTANFSDAVLLGTITAAPASGALTSLAVSNATTFRYVRYRAPLNSYGNVAELQFIGYAPVEATTIPTTGDPTPTASAPPVIDPTAPAPVAVLTAVTGTGVVVGQAVHFDALASTLNVGSPITARYEWDFGDPDSSFNKLVGFNAAHVYDKPGTFKVTLRVINEAGRISTATTTVTATAAGAVPTIYVSADGNDANGGATESAAIRSWSRAVALLGQNDRVNVLFRRGDTFDVTGEMTVRGDDVTIAAYGTGDRPVLRYAGARNGGSIIAARGAATDVVIRDLTFDSIFIDDTEQSGMPVGVLQAAKNVLVRDCVFLNLGYATNITSLATGTMLQGNSAPLITGIRGYFAWVEGLDSVIVGNTAVNSTREHIIRASGFNRMLVHGNNFTNADRRSVDPYDYDKSTVNVQKGIYAYVSGNELSGQASFGPLGTMDTIAQKDTRTTYGVFEGNHLTKNLLKIGHGAEHTMVRNNVFETNDDAQIDVQGYNADFARGVVDLAILNNTGINGGTKGNFLRTYAPVEGIRLLDNLYVAPNLKVGAYDAGPVLIYDSSLRNFTAIDSNNWGLPTSSNYAQGGVNLLGSGNVQSSYKTPTAWNDLAGVGTDLFVNLTLTAGYKPTGDDAVVYGGTAIGGVFTDYAGNYRSASRWAIGAA